jgi:hypothetical protein
VDEKGVANFADDYSKIPLNYRDKVEEVNIREMGPQPQAELELAKVDLQRSESLLGKVAIPRQ